MKFLETRIVRGQHLGENTYRKINVFDGDYTTGYKLVEFKIASSQLADATQDVSAKLVTVDDDVSSLRTGNLWNWEDNREVAWANSEMRVTNGPSLYREIVDEDAVLIEDIYFTYTTQAGADDDPVNYYIKLAKFKLEPMVGTINIVRNMSQG